MNGNGQGQSKGKEPVERVVDLFVHMPIGFAVMAWKRVPDFVVSVPDLVTQALSKGCAQITEVEERVSEEVRKARMIGQVAVTFGGRQVRREVDARLADALRKAGGVASFIPGVGADGGSNGAGAPPGGAPVSATAAPQAPATTPPATPTTKTTGAKATGATKATRAKAPAKAAGTGAATAAAPGTAAELPIREYDGLSASQVVSRLTGLTPEELRAVRAYEAASRGRRTIVLAIDRLLT
ncbi:MAG TPA: hypothetical protein VGR20_17780 [Acidimicrobiia bacterium]|nr:hypothetical protein [Acidimicrobiia bacterium]